MKITQIDIENFRAIKKQTVLLNNYTCFVGPNGAGKSTVLAALNIFFDEKDGAAIDRSKLSKDDFFNCNTSDPIRITVTFGELSVEAQNALKDYVRQDTLVVTTEIQYQSEAVELNVRQYGQRLGIKEFSECFNSKKSAQDLKNSFNELSLSFTDLPVLTAKQQTITAIRETLRDYEIAHPDKCELIESDDNFYGIQGTSKLSPYIQWLYVPAVKNVIEEGKESKNSIFSKLIARTIRGIEPFDDEIKELEKKTIAQYEEILSKNQNSLNNLSIQLGDALKQFAHNNVNLSLEWMRDQDKSIQVKNPIAGIKTGDGNFQGSLSHMGHGLQRSYLLALLQVLASVNTDADSTLILGCEEPELYQHPPQARHLADVFNKLAEKNNQILVTTHSPYFVSGKAYENVRYVKNTNQSLGSCIKGTTYQEYLKLLKTAGRQTNESLASIQIKIHQELQYHLSELFFTSVPIFVEGLEDVAYITTALHLNQKWDEFRSLGCHLIPVNKKSNLPEPIAIAQGFNIPYFVIFDSDSSETDKTNRGKHERDNKALLKLLDLHNCEAFFTEAKFGSNYIIWKDTMGDAVKEDLSEAVVNSSKEYVRVQYQHPPNPDKNSIFISDWLTKAHKEGHQSELLKRVCEEIITFAKKCHISANLNTEALPKENKVLVGV